LQNSRLTRWSVVALLIFAVLGLAWSAAWYWAAGWAERRFPGWLAEAAESGIEVTCPGRDIAGFPFALRVDCGKAAVSERQTGTNASFAGMAGGVSVLAPTTAEIALIAPARIESPLLEGEAEIGWQAATFGLGMGMSGPKDISFDGTAVRAEFPLQQSNAVIAAAHAGGKLAPSRSGGTDARAAFTELALSANGESFPPVTGTASGHLSAPPRDLLSGGADLPTPLSANGIDVALESGGAKLQAVGDVAIDGEGVVDGTITLRIAGAAALPAFIGALPPERQQIGNAVVGAILAFGAATTIDGEAASELTIEVERGEAKIGPVEITLPRLPL
jgi:hypothetical protein